MYGAETRRAALRLVGQGLTLSEVSRRTGVSRFTLREWRLRADQGRPLYAKAPAECARCMEPPVLPEPADTYAYLLGLYLGDGCLSTGRRSGVHCLRIACADAWPGLIQECKAAISAVMPHNKVGVVQAPGCVSVSSWSKHWLCLLPQHAPGKKHERPIKLRNWQQTIVESHSGALVRGLIHSDGCRIGNRVRRVLPSGERWYEYPRYLFVNESADIREIFTDGLDRLGVAWKISKRNTISVARREAVARLDEFVGPKY